METIRDTTLGTSTPRTLGTMRSDEVVPSKQSEIENDDNTVKDANYATRVFDSAAEKTSSLAKVTAHEKKSYWVGTLADFTDPENYETELTNFVDGILSRAPREGDQVSVTSYSCVFQYSRDGGWFVLTYASNGPTKQSQITNDDFTVKDANYASRVFTDEDQKTNFLDTVEAHEKKTYLVGSLANFTDPSAYQAELTAFVTTTLSRAPHQGDQVLVTGVNRVYHYDGSAWSMIATTGDVLTKQSDFTNDDNTVKDANYEDRVFTDATEKSETISQVATNKTAIAALKKKDENLQGQITKLQGKTYWVGSIDNFTDPSAYQAELSAYVQTKMERSPQQGDQVSVLDLDKIYQYNGTVWAIYTESKAIEEASKDNFGIVRIGTGIQVTTDGEISVSGFDAQNIKVLSAITLETWSDDKGNIEPESAVIVYADTSTDGIAGPALYRIHKPDDDNTVIDAYAVLTGKYYRKIKKDGIWGVITDLSGSNVNWGAITGTLSDQTDLKDELAKYLDASGVVDDLETQDMTKALSANQGRVLLGKFTDGSVTKVGTATVGGTLKPIYLDAGVPTAGTQLYKKSTKVNGSAVAFVGTASGSGPTIYAPTTVGTAGQYVKSSGTGAPTWFTQDTYAGGTAVTLNGTSKAKTTASFYAPTTSGTSGQYLKSSGSGKDPTWVNLSYGGGTAVTLNGTSKASSTASFYAPTAVGTAEQILVSSGGVPTWATVTRYYQHNIVTTYWGMSQWIASFNFVNTISTAYASEAEVAKAIAALGFKNASTALTASGNLNRETYFAGVYGASSRLYFYDTDDESWKTQENLVTFSDNVVPYGCKW